MRRTKIVCTIGPASRSPDMLCALIRAGMDVARLNFSFGSHQDHAENVRNIRMAAAAEDRPIGILMDLQGPKLRVGQVQEGGLPLTEGQEVTLTTRQDPQKGEIPVQYENFASIVEPDHRILIDDGLLELRTLSIEGPDVRCKVVTGGTLFSNKGLNLPHAPMTIPAITEKDKADLTFILQQQADWIAMSFVRTADEVRTLQSLIHDQAEFGRPTPVIAKIEKPEAIDNIDAIIEAADGIMVARGDLGIEASPEEVPLLQKMLIHKSNQMGRPVITATQMLDSMIRNPRPTRAEASDVANAILDGTDAVMLSGETTVGKYPVEAVRTMARIVEYTEQGNIKPHWAVLKPSLKDMGVAAAVAHASCQTASALEAKAILTPTSSGLTARLMSNSRPDAPIIAVTPSPMVQRQLTLLWGVHPILAPLADTTDHTIDQAVRIARTRGYAQPGDLVVVTAGAPSGGQGITPTNLMKVQRIERILVEGVGIGTHPAQGRVRLFRQAPAPDTYIAHEDIVVAARTNRTFVEVARHAAALIIEEGGADSHTAKLAVELGIPAIIGVDHALDLFHEGQEITIDPASGRIYAGYVRT